MGSEFAFGQSKMKQFETEMATGHHTAASTREIAVMASVLEGRHGALAVEIAEFLGAVHEQGGDLPRAGSWYEVALEIRRRESDRLAGRRH